MEALYRHTVLTRHPFTNYYRYGLAGFFNTDDARAIISLLSRLPVDYAAYAFQNDVGTEVFLMASIDTYDRYSEVLLLMFDRLANDAAICDNSEDDYYNFIPTRGYAIEEFNGRVLIHLDGHETTTEVYENLFDALSSLYAHVEVFY